MKVCRKCHLQKDLESFYRSSQGKMGKAAWCKNCCRAERRRYRQLYPERVKLSCRRWYLAHREQVSIRGKTYRVMNRDKIAAKDRAYRIALKNNDPERYAQIVNRYCAIRRTRKASSGNPISLEWWTALLDLFETKVCLYCSKENQVLTMDHFVPLLRGGKTEMGNLLPCCKSCNSKKWAHLPEEWLSSSAYQSISVFLDATRKAYEEHEPQRILEATTGLKVQEITR